MKYFELKELVDPTTFKDMGDLAWDLFDPEALIALDDLREYFGKPVTVNNWHLGGDFKWRGYRTPQKAASLGAPKSAHRYGRAFDLDVSGMTAEGVRQEILANKDHESFKRITRLEGDVSWVHFDVMPVEKRIRVFKKA